MTKWLTSILEDREYHLSFHLKLSSSCHLCSMEPLLPRPCVTLELEEERLCVEDPFAKETEKDRCWPEGGKRWCCRKTGGLEQAQCTKVTYSEPWHFQDDIFKPSYPECGPSGTTETWPPGLMKSNLKGNQIIWGHNWAFTIWLMRQKPCSLGVYATY